MASAAVIVFCEVLTLRVASEIFPAIILQQVVLFTRHFDLEVKVRKAVMVKIFAKRKTVFDNALCLVNDFLTLKNILVRTEYIDNRF